MAGFDSKNALSHAIRYLADTAQKRAAGGWVHPKEEERQRKEQIRQETQQQREAIRMQKEHERKEKEAKREQERAAKAEGGLLLNRQYPTHYMPNVGRQVMAEGGMPDDLNRVGLYSKAARVAAALPQKKAKGAQMVAALRDPKRGVKKEELINAGLLTHEGAVHPDWADKSVTTDELAKHFKEQLPQIEERVLGGRNSNYEPKFETYTLPGGENYREVLLKSPINKLKPEDAEYLVTGKFPATFNSREEAENHINKLKELHEAYPDADVFRYPINVVEQPKQGKSDDNFYGSHWKDDPNVLAHIRMKDRTGPNGEKILHVEELQSDWGQKGKKDGFGLDPEEEKKYNELKQRYEEVDAKLHEFSEQKAKQREMGQTPVVTLDENKVWDEKDKLRRMISSLELRRDAAAPKGPYVGTTEGWTDLALKRVLKEAAQGGYDKIVVTPGDEQTERFNLADKIKAIHARPTKEGKIHLQAYAHGVDEDEEPLHDDIHHPNDIDNVVGKEIADKIRSQIKFPEIKTGYVVQNQRSGFQTDLFDDEDAAHAAMAKYPDSIKDDLFVREATKRYAGKPVQLSGLDLKVGGQGMKAYYDKIVPSRLQALAKKHDPNASIGQYQWSSMNYPTSVNMHSLDVTPEMRQSILSGQEGYARGGSVHPDDDMIRDALTRIANPTSENPELAAKAAEIAQSAYKVPTENVTAGPSYYGFKGPMNVSDITTQIEDLPNINPVPKKEMSWEDFYKVGKGGTMINLGGDRSRLGRLTHINGKQLAWPVDLHAGPEYMLEPNPGAVWANAAGHTSGLRKKIQQASQEGPVYGVYTPMGPKTVDSSYQMFDALLSQVAANPPDKKAAKQFDDALKKGLFVMGSTDKAVKDREKEIEKMKDWPGILNAMEAREHAKTLPGSTRSLIVKYLDKAAWHKMGFPHVGVTRAAITNPDLLSAPANMMGHRIVELSPKDIQETAFSHNTYASPTAGKYVGDVPLVQRHYAMPDVIDQFLARRVGKNEDVIMHPYSVQSGGRDAARKMLEEQKQMQPVSQRMLDSIQEGLKRQAKYGLKDGGAVEDRPHLGFGGEGEGPVRGSTGSAAGNSYSGGSGSMAEARAADRESVSGYSSSGGGGGRDNYSSMDRGSSGNAGRDYLGNMFEQSSRFGGSEIMSPFVGTKMGIPARSQEQMLNALGIEGDVDKTGLPSNLRPGANIASEYAKAVVTPDFNVPNSQDLYAASNLPLAAELEAEKERNRIGGQNLALTGSSPQPNAPVAGYDPEGTKRAITWGTAIGQGISNLRNALSAQPKGIEDPTIAARSRMPSEQPSNMLGQPQFGTTQFGQSPMQSGFPSKSIEDPSIVARQSQMQSRSLSDVMGTTPQGEYLFSGMDVSTKPVPQTYTVDQKNILDQVRAANPMAKMVSDEYILGQMRAQMPENVKYQNGQVSGFDLNSPETVAGLKQYGISPSSFKPVTQTTSETQWGSPQIGAYRVMSQEGVAPQSFDTMYPMAQQEQSPVQQAFEPRIGITGMAGAELKPVAQAQPNQTIRENFNDAFAAARARGEQTFSWTNPATGKTSLYTTQLARKQGGRVPSLDNPDDWFADEAGEEKPKQTKPQNPRQAAIVRRAIMLSSKKS